MTLPHQHARQVFLSFNQGIEKYQYSYAIIARYLVFLYFAFTILPALAEARPATISAEAIRAQLAKNTLEGVNETSLSELRRFYHQHDYQPVWVQEGVTDNLLDMALVLIGRAHEEGLSGHDYQIETLSRLRKAAPDTNSLALELGITRSMLALSHDLYRGRLAATSADPDWHIPQPAFDPVDFLQQSVASANPARLEQALTELSPKIRQYSALKQLLGRLRDLVTAGTEWTQIPDNTASIHPQDKHAAIPLVRQRIREVHHVFEKQEYDIADNSSQIYDDQLVKAVKSFQRQYGLNADGVIGKNTRRALNTTIIEHIQQLRITLERLRWLPRKFSERYILVNIAGFNLAAIQDNERILEMRIVVGRDYRSTPSFSSRISHLVVNPYWNVPTSIANKDLLPKQQHNPDYFASEGIRVFSSHRYESELDPYSIDWHALGRSLPYVLRQEPGRKNALGTIKFMFPNPFSIYLHDTPSKYLFQKDIRTFSSGCIRLEKPQQLAEFVLGSAFEQANIQEKIDSGKTQTVHLPKSVPIYLLYLTAWSDEQDEVHFSSDIYGRDKRALAYARWLQPEPHLSQSF
ncbi:murein L,D-transpeptidase [Betaproteobacteria bacterium PRO4]|uniref:L,D-transpeptidase family protein n=1 Tax=Nitrosomonas sp. TaxID=42353 RepID=UPI0025672A1B|nr:L,D-transpeptidase family protein [Nitrosomonas sp.]MDL1867371.1 murein L,D-transpeptidase [Betaproteobacteria bacterium PRO4]